MSYRFMRMIVFFDLPTTTEENKRNYRRFRKTLIKNGFIMMQESVYCKMLLNGTAERTVAEVLRKEKPPEGFVQMLCVTEKQFAKMEYITGENNMDMINSDERVLVL